MPPFHMFLALLVMVLWGFNFVAAKWGLEELPPLVLTSLRFLMVALVLVWFVPRPRGRMAEVAALSVTMGSLHFGLAYIGLQGVDASVAAVAMQIQVPFAALLAWLFLGDSLGLRRAAGMAVAFLGIVLIAGEPRTESSLVSLALVIGASALWAVGAIQVKRFGPTNVLALNAWISLLAAPQMMLASAVLEADQWQAVASAGWKGWGGAVYAAVGSTIVGFGLWYRLLARHPVNQTTPFALLIPFLGVAFSVLFLGEPLTWALVAGGLLTVAGVAAIVLRRPVMLPATQGPET
jgi:O-acetylserine/cysteine efflux transporter